MTTVVGGVQTSRLLAPQLYTASQLVPIPLNSVAIWIYLVGGGAAGYGAGTGSGGAGGQAVALRLDVGKIKQSSNLLPLSANLVIGAASASNGNSSGFSIGGLSIETGVSLKSGAGSIAWPGYARLVINGGAGYDLLVDSVNGDFSMGSAIRLANGFIAKGASASAYSQYGSANGDFNVGVNSVGVNHGSCGLPNVAGVNLGGSIICPWWVSQAGIYIGSVGNAPFSYGSGGCGYNGVSGAGVISGAAQAGSGYAYGGGCGPSGAGNGGQGFAVIMIEVSA